MPSFLVMLTRYLSHVQEQALAAWRARVKAWHGHAPQLYKYLRNLHPQKSPVLEKGLKNMSQSLQIPIVMDALLKSYWGKLESWESLAFQEHSD